MVLSLPVLGAGKAPRYVTEPRSPLGEACAWGAASCGVYHAKSAVTTLSPIRVHAEHLLEHWDLCWFGGLTEGASGPDLSSGKDSCPSTPPAPALAPPFLLAPPCARLAAQASQPPAVFMHQQRDTPPPSPTVVRPAAVLLSAGCNGGCSWGPAAKPIPFPALSSVKEPQPSPQQQQQQQQQQQEQPSIGSWAKRQRRLLFYPQPLEGSSLAAMQLSPPGGPMPPMQPPCTRSPNSPPAGSNCAAAGGPSSGAGAGLRPGGGGCFAGARLAHAAGRLVGKHGAAVGETPAAEEGEEEGEEEQAWQWRFLRKWAAAERRERRRAKQPNGSMDDMEYALACGARGNLELQFAQQPQRSKAIVIRDRSYLQFDVSASDSCHPHGPLSAVAMSAEDEDRGSSSSVQRGPMLPCLLLRDDSAQVFSATSQVLNLASKVQLLLERQREIEREARARWERSIGSGGDAWAGAHLPAVQIGMSGQFLFVVLRAADNMGHQKYLVRGGGGATPAELAKAAALEIHAISQQEGLPQAFTEVVGCGVMLWREDTDRHLCIFPAPMAAGCSPKGTPSGGGRACYSPSENAVMSDVMGLAASLVREALPGHFQVSIAFPPEASWSWGGCHSDIAVHIH